MNSQNITHISLYIHKLQTILPSTGSQLLVLCALGLSFSIIASKSYAQELPSPAVLHNRSWPQLTTKDADYKIEKKMNEFGILGGISFSSPTVIGVTPNAHFGLISLRYGRV